MADPANLGGEIQQQSLNIPAISMFFIFVGLTLTITYWAAKRVNSRSDFYAAGGDLTGFQNGAAIAGDFMSAASFLGFCAAIYLTGFDALLLLVGVMAAWPIMMCLIAEPLRNLGQYTFVDVVSFRLERRPVRILSSLGALCVLIFHLIAQSVGAGKLIQLLFGLDYGLAVVLVAILMILYVSFGGMVATTWVQIIKAILLMIGAFIVAIATLAAFNFDLTALFDQAAQASVKGTEVMGPSSLSVDPFAALTLGLTMVAGTLGLPHILMRFFTVSDAHEARKSVLYSTIIVGSFYLMVIVIGIGAMALITNNPDYHDASGALVGGKNMVALHLAHAMAGNMFLGFMTAVAFATILAVVAGLTLSWVTTIAHDLYAEVICHGHADEKHELWISRSSALIFGGIAIGMGLAFEHQNVAFIGILALCVAASVNFPLLILSMYWGGLTTRGALIGGGTGLLTSVGLSVVGPMVLVDVMGFDEPLFNYQQPTIISMSLAFIAAWLFSVTDHSERAERERGSFLEQLYRSETGHGIQTSSRH